MIQGTVHTKLHMEFILLEMSVTCIPPLLHGTVHQTLNKCHQHRIAWLPVPGLISLEISNINCRTWRFTLLYFSCDVNNVLLRVYLVQWSETVCPEWKTLLKQLKSLFPYCYFVCFCILYYNGPLITNYQFLYFFFLHKKLGVAEKVSRENWF